MRSISGVDSVIQLQAGATARGGSIAGSSGCFLPTARGACGRGAPPLRRDPRRRPRGARGDFSRVGSLEAIEKYFTRLYAYSTSDGERDMLDAKNVLSMLSELSMVPRTEMPSIPFRTAAERFRMIDDASLTVIVPTETTKRRSRR